MLERQGNFSQSGVNIFHPVTHAQFPGNVIPQSRLNPIGVAIAAMYPQPSVSNVPFASNNYNGADNLKERADEFNSKVDHEFLSWWRANASYLHYSSREPCGNPFQSPAGTQADSYLLILTMD